MPREITKAPHLQRAKQARFHRAFLSDFSGVPTIPDNDPMASPRGMAIRFELPGGASHRSGSSQFQRFFPVFPTRMTYAS